MMVARFTLCVVLTATSVSAQWKRYVDEELKDSPPAHKLAYFLVDPCHESDRVLQCDPQPSAVESERRSKTRTNLREVGKIGPFVVYDLEYFFSGEEPAPAMRSVLVGTMPDRLHEIDVQGNGPNGELFPTEILDVHHRRQHVIKVKFDDGGNAHAVHEQYFVILEGAALLLDFTPVFDAASRIIPNGMMTYQPTSRFDFNSLVFHVQTEPVDVNIGRKGACCEGRVEVPFEIERGRVIAGVPRYFPE